MALPQTTSHQENFLDNFKSRDAENLELVKVIPFGTQKSTKKKGSKKTKNKGKKTSQATNPHERAGLQLRQMAGYKGFPKNGTHSFAEEMTRIAHEHQMRKVAKDKKKKRKKMSRFPKLNKKGKEEGKKEDEEGSDFEKESKESDKE